VTIALATIDTRDGNDEGVLCCPRCLELDRDRGNLHAVQIIAYDRGEDAALTKVTTVYNGIAGTALLPSAIAGNPSSRRDGVVIEFACEQCGDGPSLTIAQHKGDTLIAWRIRPASVPSRGAEACHAADH
jgi:hypothetical protein